MHKWKRDSFLIALSKPTIEDPGWRDGYSNGLFTIHREYGCWKLSHRCTGYSIGQKGYETLLLAKQKAAALSSLPIDWKLPHPLTHLKSREMVRLLL